MALPDVETYSPEYLATQEILVSYPHLYALSGVAHRMFNLECDWFALRRTTREIAEEPQESGPFDVERFDKLTDAMAMATQRRRVGRNLYDYVLSGRKQGMPYEHAVNVGAQREADTLQTSAYPRIEMKARLLILLDDLMVTYQNEPGQHFLGFDSDLRAAA